MRALSARSSCLIGRTGRTIRWQMRDKSVYSEIPIFLRRGLEHSLEAADLWPSLA